MTRLPKIEHGIPMPKPVRCGRYRRRGRWAELFRTMHAGDSFTVNSRVFPQAKLSAYVAGIRTVTQKLNAQRYRIWRLE